MNRIWFPWYKQKLYAEITQPARGLLHESSKLRLLALRKALRCKKDRKFFFLFSCFSVHIDSQNIEKIANKLAVIGWCEVPSVEGS